jgi:hypothetical protein
VVFVVLRSRISMSMSVYPPAQRNTTQHKLLTVL